MVIISAEFPLTLNPWSLELKNISCERDDRRLFSGLSCRIQPGSLLQFGGGNGVGKTTLLRILATIGIDYDGELLWSGSTLKPSLYRQFLLFLGHQTAVKQELTAKENLAFYLNDSTSGSQNTEALILDALQTLGLAAYRDTPCSNLSAGQQRKVALARLYLPAPPLWILDEPFTALDFQTVTQLGRRFSEHAAQGGAVIFTSHQTVELDGLEFINLQDYPGLALDD